MLIDHNHKPSAFGPGHCRPCANHSNLSATAPPIRRLKHLAWHHAAIFVTRPTGQPRTVFEQAVASVPHVYTPNRSSVTPTPCYASSPSICPPSNSSTTTAWPSRACKRLSATLVMKSVVENRILPL